MSNKNNIAVLIVAAGTGERFGSRLPKQYMPLLGRPVLRWSVDAFLAAPNIDSVHVVIHPDHAALYAAAVHGAEKLHTPIIGGGTRQQSVALGLEALANSKSKPDIVLIHDAARPGVTPQIITDVCAALHIAKAAIPGLPVTDTVRRKTAAGIQTENRDGLYAIQTPQGFDFDTILNLHRHHTAVAVTDDAALCELAGINVEIISGDKNNFKVTHADDTAHMEQALSARCGDIRTGSGYDVHKLVKPTDDARKLMINGIVVPHDHVLEGHSDADVGLHAITDALLATICDGDIGMHFSPKDARWKNADSAKFLAHAVSLITAQGGLVTHVDVTIICEAPKIGPHRDAMRTRIAAIMGLPVSRISVKATTTEGLGFTGRREGIAAESVVTVRLPFMAAPNSAHEDDIRKWGT
ncbi:MAG: bifunctional 2-C-methyl-D-erythritol 4-phosphate cytidylyltransferase/2-C-methyl-D-erythritol 2,4-cyclodiphosphate synthase [Micavibrio sp.]|nr:bifunctional 2-C-methyl-D-erythritol 4-phosphate cytidylyltransferase/2-C-methyl-D-erythritol 2,4-cyclodiphosphate synthase [Micavibrio sp.]